jgi:hypothetical protein
VRPMGVDAVIGCHSHEGYELGEGDHTISTVRK